MLRRGEIGLGRLALQQQGRSRGNETRAPIFEMTSGKLLDGGPVERWRFGWDMPRRRRRSFPSSHYAANNWRGTGAAAGRSRCSFRQLERDLSPLSDHLWHVLKVRIRANAFPHSLS